MNEHHDDAPKIDPAFLRGMTQRRMSRRTFMRSAGIGAGALSLSAILAACGSGGGTGGGASTNPSTIFNGQSEGSVNFANWPLYIDKAKNASGETIYPSLVEFTKQTGIKVNYADIIQDNASFFGKLQPQLAAGQDTGWDIIVITNGREFTALTANEWVIPLDPSKRPNFDKYAADFATDPDYDPGNKYSMAWQSGITGIGVNTDKVNGPVTKMDDLANPSKVGKSQVGMLKADMPDWVMINLGIDPKTSGPAEWKEAGDWLLMQRDSGTVRTYYEQGYIDDFTAGNLSATMAWSGDVLYNNVWAGYTNLEFVPSEGGSLLWIDNMLIPQAAAHPNDALTLMDFVYDPAIAVMITEWVLYMSPVPDTQKLLADKAKRAEAAGAKGYAAKLEATATSNFLYPSKAFLADTSFGRNLTTDDEREQWDAIFLPISES